MFTGPNRESVRANQKPIHRSTPKWSRSRQTISSTSAPRPKASTSNARCAGASLRAWRGPVRPVPRHRERTAIGMAKAQCLDARDDSDLQNDEPLPAQRVKRMDDLSGPQSPIGPECSSLGVCPRFGTAWCRPLRSWCWSRSSRRTSNLLPMATDRAAAASMRSRWCIDCCARGSPLWWTPTCRSIWIPPHTAPLVMRLRQTARVAGLSP
jgi:hypothetical protein